MDRARRRATYEDVLNAPESVVAEIIEGDLYTSPRPALPHAHAASAIHGSLWDPFERPPGSSGKPGGWWIVFEPELHLGADIVVPDIAGWRRERVPRLPSVAFFTETPDWACEVISPSTAGTDRVRKMRVYAREHVGYLWLVEPIQRTLEVYRLDGERWVVVSVHAGVEQVRAAPFEAVELDLSRLWLD